MDDPALVMEHSMELPTLTLPTLPRLALMRVLSLLEPRDLGAVAEAFPEVGALTRTEWSLWRGKRCAEEDEDKALAVLRAAPPADRVNMFVGWPEPEPQTWTGFSSSKKTVSISFGAFGNRMTVVCGLEETADRILLELGPHRARRLEVSNYNPRPPQLPLERSALLPQGYLQARRLACNTLSMASAAAGGGPGRVCFTHLDAVCLSPSMLWAIMGSTPSMEPGRGLRSLVLRYDEYDRRPKRAATRQFCPGPYGVMARSRRRGGAGQGGGPRWNLVSSWRGWWQSSANAANATMTGHNREVTNVQDEVVATDNKPVVQDDDPNNNNNSVLKEAKLQQPRRDSLEDSDEEFLYIVLTCCDCKDLFPTSYQLLLHRLDAHSDRRAYQCPACMATFKRPDLLAEHRRTHGEHVGDEAHACPHCGARFSLKSHVKAHGRVMHPEHHQPQQHRCSACAGVFQSAAGLASHMRCHAEAGLRGTPKPFACGRCDCRFKVRSNLNSHMKRYHPIAVEITGDAKV